jgi:hypothetical protein
MRLEGENAFKRTYVFWGSSILLDAKNFSEASMPGACNRRLELIIAKRSRAYTRKMRMSWIIFKNWNALFRHCSSTVQKLSIFAGLVKHRASQFSSIDAGDESWLFHKYKSLRWRHHYNILDTFQNRRDRFVVCLMKRWEK